jgi:hypothetical protein
MSILSRITALERIHDPEPAALAYYETLHGDGKWMLALNAKDRQQSRARRALRAYLEHCIMEMTEGHPPAFDQALEDLLGLSEVGGISRWGGGAFSDGGLWEPWGIRVEDCHLRGEMDTEEQERVDTEMLRRYHLAAGVDPTPSADDINEFQEKIAEGLERLRSQLEVQGSLG